MSLYSTLPQTELFGKQTECTNYHKLMLNFQLMFQLIGSNWHPIAGHWPIEYSQLSSSSVHYSNPIRILHTRYGYSVNEINLVVFTEIGIRSWIVLIYIYQINSTLNCGYRHLGFRSKRTMANSLLLNI